MKLYLGLIFLGFVFLVGCVSTGGIYIEDSMYSVKQHRVAISSALGLVRQVSTNGRTVFSYYHDASFKNFEITPKTKERYYTKVSVLGTIRPFRVLVEVILEQRDPDTRQWLAVEKNEDLAKKRAIDIKNLLNQSRDETTTFDEESPF